MVYIVIQPSPSTHLFLLTEWFSFWAAVCRDTHAHHKEPRLKIHSGFRPQMQLCSVTGCVFCGAGHGCGYRTSLAKLMVYGPGGRTEYGQKEYEFGLCVCVSGSPGSWMGVRTEDGCLGFGCRREIMLVIRLSQMG